MRRPLTRLLVTSSLFSTNDFSFRATCFYHYMSSPSLSTKFSKFRSDLLTHARTHALLNCLLCRTSAHLELFRSHLFTPRPTDHCKNRRAMLWKFQSHFRRLRIARKALPHFCLSVCLFVRTSVLPCLSAWLPLDGLPWNLILEIFMKLCQGVPNFIKIGQKRGVLYIRT